LGEATREVQEIVEEMDKIVFPLQLKSKRKDRKMVEMWKA